MVSAIGDSSGGRTRPGRLAFAVASRHAAESIRPILTLRIITLAVVLTVLVPLEQPLPLVACLPAVAICMLRARTVPSYISWATSDGRDRPAAGTGGRSTGSVAPGTRSSSGTPGPVRGVSVGATVRP